MLKGRNINKKQDNIFMLKVIFRHIYCCPFKDLQNVIEKYILPRDGNIFYTIILKIKGKLRWRLA